QATTKNWSAVPPTFDGEASSTAVVQRQQPFSPHWQSDESFLHVAVAILCLTAMEQSAHHKAIDPPRQTWENKSAARYIEHTLVPEMLDNAAHVLRRSQRFSSFDSHLSHLFFKQCDQ